MMLHICSAGKAIGLSTSSGGGQTASNIKTVSMKPAITWLTIFRCVYIRRQVMNLRLKLILILI